MTPSKKDFGWFLFQAEIAACFSLSAQNFLSSYFPAQLSCHILLLSKILHLQQQCLTGRRQLYLTFSVRSSSQCYSCWIFSFQASHFLSLQDLVLLLLKEVVERENKASKGLVLTSVGFYHMVSSSVATNIWRNSSTYKYQIIK